jgi:hypothetical protein
MKRVEAFWANSLQFRSYLVDPYFTVQSLGVALAQRLQDKSYFARLSIF